LARGLRGVREELPLRVVDDVGAPGLRARERPADIQLVGLAYVDPSHRSLLAVGAPAEACAPARSALIARFRGVTCRPPVRGDRPRGRSPTPCSRRTGWSGRTC